MVMNLHGLEVPITRSSTQTLPDPHGPLGSSTYNFFPISAAIGGPTCIGPFTSADSSEGTLWHGGNLGVSTRGPLTTTK
jgi:hypothetical protein